jgi:hypothetical protein
VLSRRRKHVHGRRVDIRYVFHVFTD